METGRNIHDPRNTIASPRPGEKNLRRRQARAVMNAALPRKDREYKSMPIEPKIVAHTECVWCGGHYQDGRSFVKCPRCRACQYCGLVSQDRDNCHICGNQAPDDSKRQQPARKRAHRSPQDAPKRRNRIVRRTGPQTRDRRPRINP